MLLRGLEWREQRSLTVWLLDLRNLLVDKRLRLRLLHLLHLGWHVRVAWHCGVYTYVRLMKMVEGLSGVRTWVVRLGWPWWLGHRLKSRGKVWRRRRLGKWIARSWGRSPWPGVVGIVVGASFFA